MNQPTQAALLFEEDDSPQWESVDDLLSRMQDEARRERQRTNARIRLEEILGLRPAPATLVAHDLETTRVLDGTGRLDLKKQMIKLALEAFVIGEKNHWTRLEEKTPRWTLGSKLVRLNRVNRLMRAYRNRLDQDYDIHDFPELWGRTVNYCTTVIANNEDRIVILENRILGMTQEELEEEGSLLRR
ncbi:hypothetical protein M011DRAFT_457213 [Sporormia fimetaria CBS 119925]|uniref:Uncharacterized protein n=1 Tax=Sporormia fimetaria CBS 119925 TaxID=1340428 RepID=A0A6A6VHE4_9PLEO|nr:hypothetical protein M011DRAFT_457213 [Sporormia fimetaria CBS 119925]